MIRRLVTLAAAGAVLALATAGTALAIPAANAGTITCTPGASSYTESVPATPAGSFFVSAHNSITKDAGAEFKLAADEAHASVTTRFTHCDNNGPSPAMDTTIAFEITQGGITYAALNRPGDGSRVHFEAVPASGPTLAQTWAWVTNGTTFTFQDVKSGRFLRQPNAGASQYGPVVAGASVTHWTQGPAS